MPINLTLAPEDSDDFRRSRRRHSHRRKQRWQIFLGVLAALALLAGLALVLYTSNPPAKVYVATPAFKDLDNASYAVDPVPSQILAHPPSVKSAGAVSYGELPEDRTHAKVLAVRRVAGTDNTDCLQIEYEFAKIAKPPSNYLIVLRTPAGMGPVAFTSNAARRDVVELSMALNRLGSRGPILVWIESKYAAREERRVSNIMALP